MIITANISSRSRHTYFRIVLMAMLIAGACFQSQAQGEKWIKKGEDAFAKQSYSKAIGYFEWARDKDTGLKAYEGLGKSWWALKNYEKAEVYFRLAAEDPTSSPYNHFYLGLTLMANQKYQAASDAFAWCEERLPESPANDFAGLVQLLPTLLGDSGSYEITSMPFNSSHSDFSPAYYKDGLAFSSSRITQNSIVRTSNVDGSRLTDLWYVTATGDSGWSKPKPITGLNSRVNEGPMTIDKERNRLYFTRNNPNQRKAAADGSRLNRLRIYEATAGEEDWELLSVLPFSTDVNAVGHPALSADGNRMVFTADFPGGHGGSDLYIVERQGDSWTEPRNLGPEINTLRDDLFPYLSADGTLYFASDGRLGLGGLDIFVARPNGDSWYAPVNVGFPLNTHADDFGYITNDGGKTGYFSSNRNFEASNDNIYAFRQMRPQFECLPQEENNYCYRLVDEGGLDLFGDTLPLIMEWALGDGTRILGDTAEHCYEKPGSYTVELNLVDTITGFVFMNQATYVVNVLDIEQVFIDGPDTVVIGEAVSFNGLKSVVADCDVRKFHWDFGDGSKMTGGTVMKTYANPGTYKISLGTEGDSLGGSNRCLNCVYREVVALAPERFEEVRDSIEQVREQEFVEKEQDPAYQDSLRKARQMVDKVQDIRDSLEYVYRLQLQESRDPIDPKNINFQGKDVREVDLGDRFVYTTGEEKDPKNLYPDFLKAREQGFDQSIVVPFRDGLPATDGGQEGMVRLPAKVDGKGVTIFQGSIVDSKGNPLPAIINLEDLSKGIRITRADADEMGKFRLELPNGELYGYFIDLPDYYPVSDVVDLRESDNSRGKSEIIITRPITLMTIQEIFEEGLAVRINNVFFDFDSDNLRPESKPELDRLARILIENPDLDVEIMGHTDNVGSDAYNLRLSNDRARAVMRYLVLSGYPTDKISYQGYGEARPLSPNDFSEGRQMNRRVEFRLIEPGK